MAFFRDLLSNEGSCISNCFVSKTFVVNKSTLVSKIERIPYSLSDRKWVERKKDKCRQQ